MVQTKTNTRNDKPKKRKAVKYWASICGEGEIVFREVDDDTMDADSYKDL